MINVRKTSAQTKTQKKLSLHDVSPLKLINDIAWIEFERISKAEKLLCDFNENARLILIMVADNEGCSQQDIVRETHMKKPTVSVIVTHFEEKGYVVRSVDTVDHRATHITLTEKGRETVSELKKFFSEEEKTALDGLTVNENETLIKLLSKVKTNLENE